MWGFGNKIVSQSVCLSVCMLHYDCQPFRFGQSCYSWLVPSHVWMKPDSVPHTNLPPPPPPPPKPSHQTENTAKVWYDFCLLSTYICEGRDVVWLGTEFVFASAGGESEAHDIHTHPDTMRGLAAMVVNFKCAAVCSGPPGRPSRQPPGGPQTPVIASVDWGRSDTAVLTHYTCAWNDDGIFHDCLTETLNMDTCH